MLVPRFITITITFIFGCFSAVFSVSAQIVPDNTLPVNSTVTTTGLLHEINGGTTRGVNLYHSFQDLSVPTNNTAYFNNAAQIQNVVTRVTGNSASNIDGLLKANGNANLYLLNPNGVTFGANAKLDIGGSFAASTANSYKFSNGTEFSATNPQAPPLLTTSITTGLQYGASNTGATITNLGNLSAGQDLVLNADKLDLQGTLAANRDLTLQAQDTLQIRDTVTTPFFAVAGRDLLVQRNQFADIDFFTLNNPNSGFWSGRNMMLRSDAPVIGDAHFYAGGDFDVKKLNGTAGELASRNGSVILAAGDVTLRSYGGASLHILAGGNVEIRYVNIHSSGNDTNTITPNNRYANLATFNLTEYQAIKNSDGTVKEVVAVAVPMVIDGSTQATLDVRAGVNWSILGGFPTSPIALTGETFTPTQTDGGITVYEDIRVGQPSGLVLLLGGGISIGGNVDTSTTIANANGGDIRVYSRGGITFGAMRRNTFSRLDGRLNSSSSSYSGNSGNGGAISFSSNNTINVTNTVQLSSSYSRFGNSGNGGAISFSSNSGNITFFLTSHDSSSSSDSGNSGNGGAISFSSNSGNISTNSGNIVFINSNLRAFSYSRFGDSGNGGSISFSSNSGNIENRTDLTSYSFSDSGNSENGGAISFFTNSGDIISPRSYSYSSSGSGNSGNGGAISFFTNFGDIISPSSYSYSSSDSGNSGNGGAISFFTNFGDIISPSSDSYSSSDSGNSGNGGAISFFTNSGDIISPRSHSFSSSGSGNSGDGGAISFFTSFGDIISPSSYSYSSSGSGNSGDGGAISFFTNSGDISFTNSNSQSFSSSTSGNSGNGGAISLYTDNGSIIADRSSFNSFTSNSVTGESGAGGDIKLEARDQIIISDLSVLTQSYTGQAGAVKIDSSAGIEITNVQISTSQNVLIPNPLYDPEVADPNNPKYDPNSPNFNRDITIEVGRVGSSADVLIKGLSNLTFDNSIINSATNGIAPAGNISINSSTQAIFQNNSQIAATTNALGKAGDININAPVIKVNDGSQILAETNGTGAGGNITINAPTSLELARTLNAFPILSVQTSNAGKAGNIVINTPTLTLSDLARITATATATATNPDGGGSITLNASQMNLFGTVGVFAETQGIAPAGTLKLNPYANLDYINIALAPNSQISASTSNIGRGGDLSITAPQSIYIAGQGKLAVSTSGLMDNAGKAGNITFTTSQLTLTDGVLVSASTSGKGTAGDIFVKANNFNITNGARIETATSNSGNSGNIDVRVVDQFNLTGSKTGLFANTLTGSSGAGGNIFIDPQAVTLRDGAQIAVGSLGTGIGGNITLISNFLSLLNGSSITAETASTNGGNITLNIPALLLLRYGSQISTTAGTALAGGNGGNININAGFIVGVKGENSDIFANAFRGNGGNVNISTNGIYGLEFRPLLTGFSDITASSQFGLNGTVSITTPNIDPNRGLTALPVNLTDPSKQVNQSCAIGGKLSKRDNSFTISGRGGLPQSPNDELSNTQSLVEPADPASSSTEWISISELNQEFQRQRKLIVEAHTIIRDLRLLLASSFAPLTDPTSSSTEQMASEQMASEQKEEAPQKRKPIVEANTVIRDSQGIIGLAAASTPLSPPIPQLSCQS